VECPVVPVKELVLVIAMITYFIKLFTLCNFVSFSHGATTAPKRANWFQAPELPSPIDALSLDSQSATLKRFVVDTDPLAVCNDGSPAVYYFSKGDHRLWLVSLEGGGWCWDDSTCSQRYRESPFYMSSRSYSAQVEMTGVFSNDPEKSPMSRATKVFVKYCSSDGYSGDDTRPPPAELADHIAAASSPSSTAPGAANATNQDDDGAAGKWAFRGARIVRAVLDQLNTRHGLGQDPPPGPPGSAQDQQASSGVDVLAETVLVFGGTSAGGRGAMFHLDAARTKLAALPGRVRVLGMLDSPLWVDLQPLYRNLPPLQNQTAWVQRLAQAYDLDVLDPICARDHAPAIWKCMFGQYRIPYLKTRHLLMASSSDWFQLDQVILEL